MRYVLLKLTDEAADKLVRKAGPKALGVWEVPESYCRCAEAEQRKASNWIYDRGTEQSYCLNCDGVHKPVVSLGERLRIAFLSRNIIKLYRS